MASPSVDFPVLLIQLYCTTIKPTGTMTVEIGHKSVKYNPT